MAGKAVRRTGPEAGAFMGVAEGCLAISLNAIDSLSS
jgi:hypothetical protein